jgi:uncharacterized protein with HEPN domain
MTYIGPLMRSGCLTGAQRHVLARDYGEIKHDRIWRVAETHVPELIALLQPLAPAPPTDGQESAR